MSRRAERTGGGAPGAEGWSVLRLRCRRFPSADTVYLVPRTENDRTLLTVLGVGVVSVAAVVV